MKCGLCQTSFTEYMFLRLISALAKVCIIFAKQNHSELNYIFFNWLWWKKEQIFTWIDYFFNIYCIHTGRAEMFTSNYFNTHYISWGVVLSLRSVKIYLIVWVLISHLLNKVWRINDHEIPFYLQFPAEHIINCWVKVIIIKCVISYSRNRKFSLLIEFFSEPYNFFFFIYIVFVLSYYKNRHIKHKPKEIFLRKLAWKVKRVIK